MKHSIKAALSLICLISLLFSLISCRRINAEELSANYQRQISSVTSPSKESEEALLDLTISLFQNVSDKEKNNLVISPLSAALCLSLIANGASGETLSQIENTLSCSINDLNSALYALQSRLLYENSPVYIANSLWFNDRVAFSPNSDFLQRNADYYSAKVYRSVFDSKTRDDINLWCKENTDGMIGKILDEIDVSSVLYMISAISFVDEWKEKYEKADIIDNFDFNCYDKTVSKVTALRSSENIYLETLDAVGFAKSYKDEKYSLVALLPNEEKDVFELISSLSAKKWSEMWSQRTHRTVNVILPEFGSENEFDLKESMMELGITDLFSEQLADLSALGKCDEGRLYCDLLKQKTYIKVDRSGTKAAAVTFGSDKANAEDPGEIATVFLDRPFVYAIVENESGLPLFIGCVTSIT